MPVLNLGLVAHVDAGKTTLTEQLLCRAGALRQAGSVDEGTTQTDYLSIERARGISVRASSSALLWKGTRITLVDTPGHVDFSGEVERAFAAMDAAVLVVSAVEGIQPQTEALIDALEAMKLPCAVFVNKLDRAGADYAAVLADLRERFPRSLVPFGTPLREGTDTCGVQPPDPAESRELMASCDDALVLRMLEGEEIPDAELTAAFRQACLTARAVPVLCGASKFGVGAEGLLDALTGFLTPDEPDADAPVSGIVYKVEHDPALGKLAHTRLFSGRLHSRNAVYLPRQQAEEKITQLRAVGGRRTQDIREVRAGDIAALSGLSGVRAGDVIGRGSIPRIPPAFSTPLLTVRAAADGCEVTALLKALQELGEEDPGLSVLWVPEKQEIHLRTTGRVQLEVLTVFLQERYGISARFEEPSVIYKETPIRSATGFDSYTMPKPCWAEIEFRIEPLPRGSGLQYAAEIDPRKIDYRYQAHIEVSVPRACRQGLMGWEVTDLAVTLIGGSQHHVHTHPLDFFVCTPMALMDGLRNAGTKLLEPILSVRFTAPQEYLGRTVSLLVDSRGSFDSPVVRGTDFTLEARVPAEEALDFPVRYASLTSGTGRVGMRFLEYADCPPGHGKPRERTGVNPLDRSLWILHARGAYAGNIE